MSLSILLGFPGTSHYTSLVFLYLGVVDGMVDEVMIGTGKGCTKGLKRNRE